MSSCERCWSEARRRVILHGETGSVSRVYLEVLKEREDAGVVCTPREQAGQYWDEEKQRDTRADASAARASERGDKAVSAHSYLEFSGRIGSGLCTYRCAVCGNWAWWPSEQIIHADKCPATLPPSRPTPKESES